MKIFISWSGSRSHQIGKALYDWIPYLLPYTTPFISESDISAGDRWAINIANELEASNFGLICITPENIDSPWVMFEAGALSKSIMDARVIPILFEIDFSGITGPLSQFQAKKLDKQGITEVIRSINNRSDHGILEGRISTLVDSLWPQLDSSLSKINTQPFIEKKKRPPHEILEEVIAEIRTLNNSFRLIDSESGESNVALLRGHSIRGYNNLHTALQEESIRSLGYEWLLLISNEIAPFIPATSDYIRLLYDNISVIVSDIDIDPYIEAVNKLNSFYVQNSKSIPLHVGKLMLVDLPDALRTFFTIDRDTT